MKKVIYPNGYIAECNDVIASILLAKKAVKPYIEDVKPVPQEKKKAEK